MSEPGAVLQVRLKKTSPWLIAVLMVCSFGLLLPLWGLALLFDRRPRTLDGEGLTTVRGRRYLWRDLQETVPAVEYRRTSTGKLLPVHRSLRMRFSTGSLAIVQGSVENEQEVIRYIERIVGRSLQYPA